MANQAPVKVNPDTHARIRYLAALTSLTQGEVVERAVMEFAVRHPDLIEKGLDEARSVLNVDDNASLAAYLLDMPAERVKRVAGKTASAATAKRAPSAAAVGVARLPKKTVSAATAKSASRAAAAGGERLTEKAATAATGKRAARTAAASSGRN